MKRDGIASWTTLIQSENKISKNSPLEGKVNKLIWAFYSTVEPCFNKPLYITKFSVWRENYIPSPSTCKIYEKNRDIVKLCYGKHFYCPLLSPLLHLRIHCNTAFIMYIYHVPCSPFNIFTLLFFFLLSFQQYVLQF